VLPSDTALPLFELQMLCFQGFQLNEGVAMIVIGTKILYSLETASDVK
jgi:hypothetical protein